MIAGMLMMMLRIIAAVQNMAIFLQDFSQMANNSTIVLNKLDENRNLMPARLYTDQLNL
jgi:hypothetical protein